MTLHMLTEPMTPGERAAVRAEREQWAALEARIAELEAALRPFAAACFRDNGDVTVSQGHIETRDWMMAADVLRGWTRR